MDKISVFFMLDKVVMNVFRSMMLSTIVVF